jgi:competence protein ComEC
MKPHMVIKSQELSMGRVLKFLACLATFSILYTANAVAKAPKSLQVYSIDVEGGQSTLIVSPSGQSLLIDTGWPQKNGAERVMAAVKQVGLSKIDYVLITHYHHDHVGGVPELVKMIKIGTFVDHGPNMEDSDITRADYAAYQKAIVHSGHIVAKPGDTLPIKGIRVQVLTAAGKLITAPLPGAGQPNPYCASEPTWPADQTENARSLGTLLTYGRFRMLDLGDLTKDKEVQLVCPRNLIGKVDLFIVTHHGFNQSNSKSLVDAIHARVAVMNNGAHKGASPDAWQTVHDAPGLQDLWQLHYAVDGGKDHNVADAFIANTENSSEGNYIKITAKPDGGFTVFNSRNHKEKNYKK